MAVVGWSGLRKAWKMLGLRVKKWWVDGLTRVYGEMRWNVKAWFEFSNLVEKSSFTVGFMVYIWWSICSYSWYHPLPLRFLKISRMPCVSVLLVMATTCWFCSTIWPTPSPPWPWWTFWSPWWVAVPTLRRPAVRYENDPLGKRRWSSPLLQL